MQAIVFADRIGKELGRLCSSFTPANLPFLNRPLLEHCLIELSLTGVDQVLIVVSEDSDKIRTQFDVGAVFGLTINYVLSRGEENPFDVIQRVSSRLKAPYLVLRGDIYHGGSLTSFFQKTGSIEGALLEASVDGQAAGLALVRQWPVDLGGLGWPVSFVSENKVAVTADGFSLLDTPNAYFQTQLRLLKSASSALPYTATHREEGLWVEPLASVDSRSLCGGHSLVGENTIVHKSALLKGDTVVGTGCYISRGVNINNSIILPDTYIGNNLNIENAIVGGGYIHSLPSNTEVEVYDPALLSNLTRDVQLVIRQWQERSMAVGLLLLSLPLWPIALIASWDMQTKRFTSHEKIVGNCACKQHRNWERGVIEVWRFNTYVPVLRNMPMLIPVIFGDLRLFGHEPVLACQLAFRTSKWDHRLKMRASGVLGPRQLELHDDVPEEEVRLAEIVFVGAEGIRPLLRRLYQAAELLFSHRSWVVSHNPVGRPK